MLGDFNNGTFKTENETTRFSRKDDGFWVNTPGIDGKNADFKVAYTFGIAPLQQYLIEVGNGNLRETVLAARIRNGHCRGEMHVYKNCNPADLYVACAVLPANLGRRHHALRNRYR